MTLNENAVKPLAGLRATVIYLFVFISGFISLASEIIGPRLFASLFGTTTIIWAIMISVSLGGLSVGYYIGGHLSLKRAKQLLPVVLVINALWLLAASWIIWNLPPQVGIGIVAIIITAMLAFFAPFILFGTISPIAITLLSEGQPSAQVSRIVGNIYALSTVGSVLGALVAAFGLIPFVGLSASLRIFSLILVLFAGYFWSGVAKSVGVALLVVCVIAPQPTYQWENESDILLTQREGYFQTIRIYTDKAHSAIVYHLGPQFESDIDPATGEPLFGYSKQIVQLAGDVTGKHILVIGGAGHAIARALEKEGAILTEVEIDPVVIETSDQFFGPLQGQEVNQDGRTYLEQAAPGTFDDIIIDAYNGPASVPTQLTTLECFKAVQRDLKPGGRMFYNFIGVPNGPDSESYRAIAKSMSGAFNNVYVSDNTGTSVQNIILTATDADIPGGLNAPTDGTLLTDDLNPMDLFLLKARQGVMEYRR